MLVSHANRSRVYQIGFALIASLGASVASAEASSISLNSAVGQWQDAVLAPADADYAMSSLWVNNLPADGVDTASWGDDYGDYGILASSYLFRPTSDQPSIPVGTPFVLGTFTHVNNGIPSNGITAIDYALAFNITGGVPMPLTTLIHFAHNETLNQADLCPGDAVACDDIVTTSLPGQTSFVLNGSETLYLHLLGFSRDGGATFANQFFSREGGSNDAMLYGLVSSEPPPVPNPEPATMVLFGTGLAAIVVARQRSRRGKK